MPIDLLIPQPLAQAIADYLMQRPYREVAGLVDALARLQPAPQRETLQSDELKKGQDER